MMSNNNETTWENDNLLLQSVRFPFKGDFLTADARAGPARRVGAARARRCCADVAATYSSDFGAAVSDPVRALFFCFPLATWRGSSAHPSRPYAWVWAETH
ncbi:hypothetical protein EVAR_97368_1 [Eumeta japonica]|uniref:Uncharacterized protein n=1 Tax=Eumeta variegata TaxID=151549 RepID=A0A4C1YZD7_EUMVA|nr:hypothetical protein EVAR_97368_1 [Eumeta japonica]